MVERLSLKQMMDELDRREQQDQLQLGVPAEKLEGSVHYAEIKRILNEQPILVQPCLRWLHAKMAEIATAQLRALYTDEQIEAMRKELVQ